MHNLITHKYLAVAPDFQFSKCVCKSQNRKCFCKSQNGHMQSIPEEVDRGVLTMVCVNPYWCPVDYMQRNYHGAWSKTGKTGIRVFCDLKTFLA